MLWSDRFVAVKAVLQLFNWLFYCFNLVKSGINFVVCIRFHVSRLMWRKIYYALILTPTFMHWLIAIRRCTRLKASYVYTWVHNLEHRFLGFRSLQESLRSNLYRIVKNRLHSFVHRHLVVLVVWIPVEKDIVWRNSLVRCSLVLGASLL